MLGLVFYFIFLLLNWSIKRLKSSLKNKPSPLTHHSGLFSQKVKRRCSDNPSRPHNHTLAYPYECTGKTLWFCDTFFRPVLISANLLTTGTNVIVQYLLVYAEACQLQVKWNKRVEHITYCHTLPSVNFFLIYFEKYCEQCYTPVFSHLPLLTPLSSWWVMWANTAQDLHN